MTVPRAQARQSLATHALRFGVTRAVSLSLFTRFAPAKAPAGIALLAGMFLVLAAYYFVDRRDGLLAVSPAGGVSETELKAYSSFGQ